MHACLVRTTKSLTEPWTIQSAHRFCEETSTFLQLPIISGPHVTALEGHIYAMAILPQGHISIHLDKTALIAHLDLYIRGPGVAVLETWKDKGRAMFGETDRGQV